MVRLHAVSATRRTATLSESGRGCALRELVVRRLFSGRTAGRGAARRPEGVSTRTDNPEADRRDLLRLVRQIQDDPADRSVVILGSGPRLDAHLGDLTAGQG
jgi:hypothetical protein